MINVEMFKRIEEIIVNSPDEHNQDDYEYSDECGTTRCVAGWAIHLWGRDNGHTGDLRSIRWEYMKTRSKPGDSDYPTWVPGSAEVGEHILGLSGHEANELFYNMDNSDALRMVREYASGHTDVRRKYW